MRKIKLAIDFCFEVCNPSTMVRIYLPHTKGNIMELKLTQELFECDRLQEEVHNLEAYGIIPEDNILQIKQLSKMNYKTELNATRKKVIAANPNVRNKSRDLVWLAHLQNYFGVTREELLDNMIKSILKNNKSSTKRYYGLPEHDNFRFLTLVEKIPTDFVRNFALGIVHRYPVDLPHKNRVYKYRFEKNERSMRELPINNTKIYTKHSRESHAKLIGLL